METTNLLNKRAYLTPHREALAFYGLGEPQRYTYAQLNARSNRLANWMRDKLGIQKGDRVSILAHNSLAYVDLFYGLPKIGAILAPLNWRLAAKELTYIINDCQPKVLICGPEFVDVVAQMRPNLNISHYISLEEAPLDEALAYEAELALASDAEPARPLLTEEDTWAILYTSGTTGRPKGAMIPHRQIVWNCINTITSWGLTEHDVSPVYTPLFHAGGLFAFLTPLFYVGGRIVMTRTFELEETLNLIQAEQCTVVLGVPTIFQMWMDTPTFTEADFSCVRFFISGGAPLPVALVEQWLAEKGGVFRQGYGLTEVGANCFSMTDEDSVTKRGSVGKPIFHSQMRLVDPAGQDVPVDAIGELTIAGPHVCTGYWQNPTATEAVIRDGWFHTGDMARMDEDGFFYIMGRFKDMIISGGENVYAAEVEAIFREQPAVAEAALIGKPDEKWGEVGLMVVVLQKGATATAEDLLAFCEEHLARYKIPKEIHFVDALPYSPYGKVMKSKLVEQFVGSS